MRALPLAIAAALAAAAPAAAAPDHTFTAPEPTSYQYEWTSGPGAGLSDAQKAIGCIEINCSFQLFAVTDEGTITVQTKGDQPSIADLDIHVFESDADGTQGDEIASGTAFSPSESAATDVTPGFYLVRVDTSGAGTFTGTASWAPLPEEEQL